MFCKLFRLLLALWFLFSPGILLAQEVITPQKKQRIFQKISDLQIINYAKEMEFFDPYFVLAIVKGESSGDPTAVLEAHNGTSVGLMQLLPSTARMLGFKGNQHDLFKWEINLFYGITYLENLMEVYGQHLPSLAAAYNAGKVFICKNGKVKTTGEKCKKGQYTNQKYVDKVMKEYLKIKMEYEYLPTVLGSVS